MIAPVLRPFVLEGDLANRARWTAIELGERLLYELREPARRDVNFERYPCKHMNGTVGFALAFLALLHATGDERFERAMHEQLKLAAESPDGKPGLFDGVAGLRAVAALAASVEPRYRGFVRRCDDFTAAASHAPAAHAPTYATYDVFSGWAGIRLARCVEAPAELDGLTASLAWLIEDRARWACPRAGSTGALEHNLGMAHGLPGVLAALAITSIELPASLRDALGAAARGLAQAVRLRDGAREWPRTAEDPPDEACRSVWCYGAMGVASALLAVAQHVGDLELERFAADTLRAHSRRAGSSMGTGGEGICHGTIGNALMFFVAARRLGDGACADACRQTTAETIDRLEAAGWRCRSLGYDGVPYDALGELNGVAGVVAGLLTMVGDFDARWLRCHALDSCA